MRRMFLVSLSTGLLLFFGLAGTASAQTRGTVSVQLVDSLSTEKSQPGDSFAATLADPLVVDGRVVAQKNARVTGRVGEVISSGRLKQPAMITLRLESVQSPSGRYPIETGDLTIKAGSHTTRNVVIIGGSAGAGAAIGGAMGGGKGAAIGAATGAGAGTLAAYLTGKREIALPPETALTFQLNSVAVSSRELSRMPRLGEEASRSQAGRETREDRDSRSAAARRRERGEREEDEDREEADERGREYGRGTEIIFTTRERTLIGNWFRTHPSNLPPGLAKRDRLPPGLEKQLRERGTLPPGLQKRVQPLPSALEVQLPRLPGGYRRVIIGGHVILMNEKTSVISDIIRNVMQ